MKLDIKAAFDSVHHRSIGTLLYRAAPCREALRLWELVRGNTVLLQMNGEHWHQPSEQGVMQGTSYSAELFSRLMSWGLEGLEDRWNAVYGPSLRGILAPHMLLFADDALIFGRDPQELQGKLWDLQNSLDALGLSVNSDKCSILASPECPRPGVWALRSCMPLKSFDQFIFLGAPLGYGLGPLEVLGHSLRKASNSFFGFKRILSAPACPLKIKFTLLDTYITSRWRWLAPAAFPTVRAVDSLEAMKNTFLLSHQNSWGPFRGLGKKHDGKTSCLPLAMSITGGAQLGWNMGSSILEILGSRVAPNSGQDVQSIVLQ